MKQTNKAKRRDDQSRRKSSAATSAPKDFLFNTKKKIELTPARRLEIYSDICRGWLD